MKNFTKLDMFLFTVNLVLIITNLVLARNNIVAVGGFLMALLWFIGFNFFLNQNRKLHANIKEILNDWQKNLDLLDEQIDINDKLMAKMAETEKGRSKPFPEIASWEMYLEQKCPLCGKRIVGNKRNGSIRCESCSFSQFA